MCKFGNTDIRLLVKWQQVPDFEGEVRPEGLPSEASPCSSRESKKSSKEDTVKDAAAEHPGREPCPQFKGIVEKSAGLVRPKMS